jgi:toxin ParE1/3/4
LAEQASKRIAAAYLDEFDRVASLVTLYPKLGTPEIGGYRSYPLSKYKYSLIYFEDVGGTLILAVASQSREPGYWKARTR